MEMWAVFGILVLMILVGLGPLHHIVCSKHTSRDLWCVIPLATLTLIGLVSLVNNAANLVVGPPVQQFGFDSTSSLIGVNIVILSLLWRSVRMVNLAPTNAIRLFTFFVMYFVGMMPLRSLMPPGQQLSVILSSEYPDLFQTAPMQTFVLLLCLEYIMFYLPVFFVMYRLYSKRADHRNTALRAETGCVVTQSGGEEDCPRCATTSPFLDIVTLCLGVMFIVLRPLYVLYYWWMYGVVTDIENNFYIFPYYVAMCLLNIQRSGIVVDEKKSTRNLLQVCSG